jgi:dipeptidyl aminopeptidase/acylaminoacyl peptidase
VLLAEQRVIARGIGRRVEDGAHAAAPEPREYRTLIFEDGRVHEGPVVRPYVRVLTVGETADTVRLHSVEFEGRPVLFAQAGEGPHPHESPAEPGLYVVERGDRLWLLTRTGVTQLTGDTIRGIVRDTLQSQQREGVRHLYWATSPLWSPDGSAVAYVTNRTWMLGRPSGQEVWLVDLRPRREHPLLSERGQFFAPIGWLGTELVYTSREPGIFAVDGRTGARRTIAVASPVAVSPSASRLLYMTSRGDADFRAHVLTERGAVVNLPDPPPGERLSFGGTFSPGGDHVVLETTFARDSGVTRALYVFDLGAKRLTRLLQWSLRDSSPRLDTGPAAWLDDSTLLLTEFDRGTGMQSSTVLRLRGMLPARRKD